MLFSSPNFNPVCPVQSSIYLVTSLLGCLIGISSLTELKTTDPTTYPQTWSPTVVPRSGTAPPSSQLFKSHLCLLSPKSHTKYISYSSLFYLQNLFPKSEHSPLLPLQALPPSKPPSLLASTDIISISLLSPLLPSASFQHHGAIFSKQKPDHVTPLLDTFLPSPQGFSCTLGTRKPLHLRVFPSTLSTCSQNCDYNLANLLTMHT